MPTLPSMLIADCIALFLSQPWCRRVGSATCQPTRYTGLSEVIGSWKIIAISRPRISRISYSLIRVRSWPLNMTFPPTIRPGRCRRMMLSAVTDLPQPDSPTMPSVSPALSSNETPSTALTMPSLVEKTVCRSRTSSSGCVTAGLGLQSRVESIPDGVAEDVRGQDGEKDREPWKSNQEPGAEEVALGVRQHVAPARCRRLDAEAEEVQGRLDEDDLADAEAGGDDQHREDVGQQVANHQARVPGADRPRGEDEIALLHRQHLAADQACHLAPSDRGDNRGQGDRVRPNQDRHEDEEEDGRDRKHGVDDPHEDVVDPAPVVPGHHAD